MNQKKLNNKGFSLVELIIVIAIMAVLIGLLAPQFLKYVQRSKYSTDVKNGQEIATVIQTLIADNKLTESVTTAEAFSGTQKAYVAGVGDGKLLAEAPKSKVSDSNVFKVKYDVKNGKVEVYITDGTNESEVFPELTGEYKTKMTE
jgi:hypothetical protein